MSRWHRALIVGASECLVVALAAGAAATPGTGVSSSLLARGVSPDGIAVDRRGPADVTIQEITIAPGGSTGWHYHDGDLIALVKSGTLTRTLHDCSRQVTAAGGSFVEVKGQENSHVGTNLGAEPVVLLVTYVMPAGEPLSRDAPAPACAR